MKLENFWFIWQFGWFFVRVDAEPNPIQSGYIVRLDVKTKKWINRKLHVKLLILKHILRLFGFQLTLIARQLDGSDSKKDEGPLGELFERSGESIGDI